MSCRSTKSYRRSSTFTPLPSLYNYPIAPPNKATPDVPIGMIAIKWEIYSSRSPSKGVSHFLRKTSHKQRLPASGSFQQQTNLPRPNLSLVTNTKDLELSMAGPK
ncbi:hypothetical protein TNCV_2314851 [Trichonephila clavipes]|nr:hypothetical protein TNCV_2314851 [Trichonephila clavipes]